MPWPPILTVVRVQGNVRRKGGRRRAPAALRMTDRGPDRPEQAAVERGEPDGECDPEEKPRDRQKESVIRRPRIDRRRCGVHAEREEIGRASSRRKMCQNGESSVG